MANDSDRRTLSLQHYVAGLFLLLFICTTGAISFYNYQQTTEIIEQSMLERLQSISDDITQQFSIIYNPVFTAVRTLSYTDITRAETLPERLQQLPILVSSSLRQEEVTAIQIGYPNGDFFIVRPVTPAIQQRFEAPPNSRYVVDNIEREGELALLERLFFDRHLTLIQRNTPLPTEYDPRRRDWFQQAYSSNQIEVSNPYVYYFIQEIGVTVGYRNPKLEAVVAADVTLTTLSNTLIKQAITPSEQLLLSDLQGYIVAYNEPDKIIQVNADGSFDLAQIGQLSNPTLQEILANPPNAKENITVKRDGRTWLGRRIEVNLGRQQHFILSAAFPEDELFARVIDIQTDSIKIQLLFLFIMLPLLWLTAAKVSRPIEAIAKEAKRIQTFDFNPRPMPHSGIQEVRELVDSIAQMKSTIAHYNRMIESMTGEKDFNRLLQLICHNIRRVSQASLSAIYIYDDQQQTLISEVGEYHDEQGSHLISDLNQLEQLFGEHTQQWLTQTQQNQQAEWHSIASEQIQPPALREQLNHSTLQTAFIPLINRNQECIGVLALGIAESSAELSNPDRWQGFVHALSSFSALTLESRHLIQSQKDLLDAVIQLIAGAIDAKSPYTGAHCQRVPVLTKLIAQAACDSQQAPFKEFQLNKEEWEALHCAAWLHDCGKVTTPEYVVDKATKLETLYDRIHEIRMRFEVLKRDATIRYWQARCETPHDSQRLDELERQLDAEHAELDAEFACVAECNVGSESTDPEALARLDAIAQRTWLRTLSDRIGISWEEAERKRQIPEPALPIEEPLLADRPEQIIPRTATEQYAPDNPWGFKVEPPEYLYNRGELYNLKIASGTLSPEERFTINDHMAQTIIMLEQLPYPKHLREIPNIAGGHHETMIGTGYPKRLTREEMPTTARMMAIADIFEALTAGDRPYKQAKPLSEALEILANMARKQHIDRQLFTLFIEERVYLQYAKQFLSEEQLDLTNIDHAKLFSIRDQQDPKPA